MISEWIVFIVTFIAFPGLCFHMDISFIPGAWAPITIIIIFNFFDTVGRQVGGMPVLAMEQKGVIMLAISRLIFVVFFFLFAFKVGPSFLFGKDADWLKIIILIMFAFTNGFTSTKAAMIAPGMVPDDLKATVGSYIGIFIMIGIVTGSFCAIGVGEVLPKPPKKPPVKPPKTATEMLAWLLF